MRAAVGICVCAALMGAGGASGAGPDPFARRTAVAQQTYANIDALAMEVEMLRAEASRESKPTKLACLEEKAKRAKANAQAAKGVMDGWSLARENADRAQKQLDRLMLLHVYAMVFADEARGCTELRVDGSEVRLEVKGAPEPKGEPRGERRVGSEPTRRSDFDPSRPPRFERPPLASPF